MPRRKIETIFMDSLPKDGSPISNLELRKNLSKYKISSKKFDEIKDRLIANGILSKYKGKGGAVRLVEGGTLPPKPSKNGDRRIRKLILKKLPQNGARITNKDLINRIRKDGVDEKDYWRIRNELINQGILLKGTGQGGSVFLNEEKTKIRRGSKRRHKYTKEKNLYSPFQDVIQEFWPKEYAIDPQNCVIELTANQGKRKTGGKWTRPDLIIVAVNKYQYYPGLIFELISFEVKPADNIDIKWVFETASHSRFAHKSYLAVYMPEGADQAGDEIERLRKECVRFGIGFIYFSDPANWETYDVMIESVRKNPAPEDINNFISSQISEGGRAKISKLLH